MSTTKKVGVLSLQGSVEEHMHMLRSIDGNTPLEVKTLDALNEVDGLILPGGESTTISKLLRIFGLFEPLKERILQGMPVWGTCAGMILLAKQLVGETPHLGVMDITVRRNAYGTQLDSFTANASIPEISEKEIPLVFVRAPWVEAVGENVNVLCRVQNHIVAARQGNMLVTSFHPELTEDLAVHRYFVGMIKTEK
jgi:5'-phosphate synthase pdxT subunit